jgi:hypothetical protein
MKKVLVLATAAFLFSGMAFAQQAEGKKCGKDSKECCSKECAKKAGEKKDAKATPKAAAAKKA